MELIKPFLAGSFAAAAAIRLIVTVFVDVGAASLLEIVGLARFGTVGVALICMIGGAAFAWRTVRHPTIRAKKS